MPGAVNYLLSTDESSGVISLTPFAGEREWEISENLSTKEELSSYCSTLGTEWKAPATQNIDIELRKDDESKPDAIRDFLEAVDDPFLTPITYVTDERFIGKLAFKYRHRPNIWNPFDYTLAGMNRALCFKELNLKNKGKGSVALRYGSGMISIILGHNICRTSQPKSTSLYCGCRNVKIPIAIEPPKDDAITIRQQNLIEKDHRNINLNGTFAPCWDSNHSDECKGNCQVSRLLR